MFAQSGGYSLSDIAAVSGNDRRGGFGDDYWWIILLFLFGFGNNGWGNGNGGGATTREEIAYGFDMNGLENNVRGIQQGLCDGFYSMNTGMLNGFSGIQNALCQGFSGINTNMNMNTNAIASQLSNMAAENAACCCETQRAIERGFCDTNYNLASQSCETRRAVSDSARDIIENQNAGVKSILDFLTQDKISTLAAENQTLKFAASQQAQNAYLINALRDPCPVPAYVVPNPNSYVPTFSNCGNF